MADQPGICVDGVHYLPISPAVVWAAMNDPEVLTYCIKGCDAVVLDNEGGFDAVFGFRVGPFNKSLSAKMVVEDVAHLSHYKLSSKVGAELLGDANGVASVYLQEINRNQVDLPSTNRGADRDLSNIFTELRYEAEIVVNGWFARLGEPLLKAAADRYMKTFFERFVEMTAINKK